MTVTLYVSAPPASQYQKGATLAIEGEHIEDAALELDQFLGERGVGVTLVKDIVGSNLARAVLAVDPDQGPQSDTAVGNDAPAPSPNLVKAAAKKSGKAIEEIQKLSIDEVKALMKGAK